MTRPGEDRARRVHELRRRVRSGRAVVVVLGIAGAVFEPATSGELTVWGIALEGKRRPIALVRLRPAGAPAPGRVGAPGPAAVPLEAPEPVTPPFVGPPASA